MTNTYPQPQETQRQKACKQVCADLQRVAKLVNKNFKSKDRVYTDELTAEIKEFISKELDIPMDKVFIEHSTVGTPVVLNFGPYDDEVLDLLINREIKKMENNMKNPRQSLTERLAKSMGVDDEANTFVIAVPDDKQELHREKMTEIQQNMALVNQAVGENKPLSLGAIGVNSEDPQEIAQQLSQKLGIPADSINIEDITLPQFHEKDKTRLDTYGQIKTPIGASVSDILSQIEDTYATAEEADSFKMARKMASDPAPLKPYSPKHPPIKWTQVGGTRVQDPNRATSGSGGFDLYSTVRVDIPPGCNAKIGTGIKMAIPEGWVGIICPRSGVAAKSRVVPGARIIDSDYRGEIFIDLHNRGQDTFEVLKGERYVQIIFVPVNTNMEYVDSLDDVTERGEGGFGSTGVK